MSVGVTTQSSPPRPRRFTVEDFYRMAEAGVLGKDHQRIELIEGELLKLRPIGPSHAGHVLRLVSLFNQKLAGQYLVNSQNPLRLSEFSEPIPDVAVLRRREDFYTKTHPGPEDALLLVEVADTSLDYDVGRKGRMYAQAGIAEYWVLDLAAERVRVFRAPEGEEFRETLIVRRGDTVSCRTIPELSVTVEELLG